MFATLFELTYSTPVVGSNDAPDQFAPPWKPGTTTVPCVLGGLKAGPPRIVRRRASTDARFAGPMSVTLVSIERLDRKRRRLDWNRLRQPRPFRRGCPTQGPGRSVMSKSGLPVSRSNRNT